MKSPRSNETRLNVPYIATLVGDYAFMAANWTFAYLVASNEKLNLWTGAACLIFAIVVNTTREYLYWVTLGHYFAKCKTESKVKPNHFVDIVNTSLIVAGIAGIGCFTGNMTCEFDFDGTIEGVFSTLWKVSRDFWILNLIKDNTSMRYVHPWMHQRENFWIHKRHHEGNKNLCQFPGTFLFGVLDLMIEFGIGPVLGLAVKYYVFGLSHSTHLVAFMCSVWQDGNVHSLNPYTQAIGNPILDFLVKTTVLHNLHHACPHDERYMVVYQWDHITTPGAITKDLHRYNQIMDTNIDFRFFV